MAAIDVNNTAAAGADAITVIDPKPVTVAIFEPGHLKGAASAALFIPKRIDRRSSEQALGHASRRLAAFHDRAGRDLPVVISKWLLPIFILLICIKLRRKPLVHPIGHGDVTVA